MPASHRFGHLLGVGEAQTLQGREGVGVVRGAGEDEIAHIGGKVRPLLEQQRVMALHDMGMPAHLLLEGLERRIARELGEALDRIARTRQALRLLVRDHLDAMLEGAQKPVGLAELVPRRGADPALVVQGDEHIEGAPPPQRRAPSAEHELLGLDEELDLAMPPRPSLMSWPATAISSCPRTAWICRFMACTSAMEAKSKYLRQMKGAGPRGSARLARIARHGPRLDERRALPVLAHGLVIGVGEASDTAVGVEPGPAAGGNRPGGRSRPACAPAGARERLRDAGVEGGGLHGVRQRRGLRSKNTTRSMSLE
jgi:hypothetical protein